MRPFQIGKSETDLGACVKLLCPHCQQVSEFRLRSRSLALRMFRHTLVEFDKTYDLACRLCEFCKEIPAAELSSATSAARLYAQMSNEGVVEYWTALQAINCPTINALMEEGKTWSCPSCKESVPMTLKGCWNCNTPRPGLSNPDADQPENSPRLPNTGSPSNFPWEQ